MSEAPETSVATGKTHKSFFSKHGLRQVVSQKRVRFQDGTYDLDLSFVCPNIIAMGLPAKGMDAMFRNNENDVASMLNRFHPNSYTIYNLSQKKYDYSLFSRVLDLGWKDHHAPGLELLFENVNSMCEFLKQDFKNVVIVHCKAGKGRTGTSIAALLVYCGLYRTPEEALKYFSYRRAHSIDPKDGVTIPSQKRYIKYFADILAGTQIPNKNKYKINSISVSGVPMYDKKPGAKLVVHLMHDTIHEIYNGKKEPIKLEPGVNTQGTFSSQALQDVELEGDVMLKFSNVGFFNNEEVKFRISFNTHMIEGDEIYWVFYRHDLDDAYKDDDVPTLFKVEVRMTKSGESPTAPPGTMTQWEKALKNRHLYQDMFRKMSYQESKVYDPANNIGDTMDNIPDFLSRPQLVVNGQIIENQSTTNQSTSISLANLDLWSTQQEEHFQDSLVLSRNHSTTLIRNHSASLNNNFSSSFISNHSGGYNSYTPSPTTLSRSSTHCAQPSSSSSQCPPPLPRGSKPSLAQWEGYFKQHQVTSNAPVSILGVMLQTQCHEAPVTTSHHQTAAVDTVPIARIAVQECSDSPPPCNSTLFSTASHHLPPPPPPPTQPKNSVAASLASLVNKSSATNHNYPHQNFTRPHQAFSTIPPGNRFQPQTSHQQPAYQRLSITSTSASVLPPPPPPPTPSPSATQQQYQVLQSIQTHSTTQPRPLVYAVPHASDDDDDDLPLPPAPPTPRGAQLYANALASQPK